MKTVKGILLILALIVSIAANVYLVKQKPVPVDLSAIEQRITAIEAEIEDVKNVQGYQAMCLDGIRKYGF
ncbi:MAG: hypothetical protein WC086_01895 [Dehalococcoidales bacterium]|jgi:uncharacterized linocin/CFP29 family protein